MKCAAKTHQKPTHIITDTRHLKHLNLSYCNSLILIPLNLLKGFQNIYKYTVWKHYIWQSSHVLLAISIILISLTLSNLQDLADICHRFEFLRLSFIALSSDIYLTAPKRFSVYHNDHNYLNHHKHWLHKLYIAWHAWLSLKGCDTRLLHHFIWGNVKLRWPNATTPSPLPVNSEIPFGYCVVFCLSLSLFFPCPSLFLSFLLHLFIARLCYLLYSLCLASLMTVNHLVASKVYCGEKRAPFQSPLLYLHSFPSTPRSHALPHPSLFFPSLRPRAGPQMTRKKWHFQVRSCRTIIHQLLLCLGIEYGKARLQWHLWDNYP